MNLISFVDRFQQRRSTGNGFLVSCPAHDDRRSSLSVGPGENGGILLYCHAGCQTRDILAAMGLQMSDLMPVREPEARQAGVPSGFVARYDYRDVDGTLLFQVLRKANKDFYQRKPKSGILFDGDPDPLDRDQWDWKVAKKVKRVPYRLPDLLGKQTIYVVEGEKDANNLHAIGIPATCNAGGAGKWGQTETKILRDACGCQRVVIIPDNDGPGVNHANDVAGKCRNAGMAVTILQLPGLPEHGDVSDWLRMGHTKDELEQLAATPFVLPAPRQGGPQVPVSAPRPATGLPEAAMAYLAEDDGQDALYDPTIYAPPGSAGIPHDVGAAEAFKDRYGDRVRYDHTAERWLIWDGHFWKPDDNGAIRRLAKDHIDKWQQEAIRASTYVHKNNLVNFVLKLDKRSGMDNMLAAATWQLPIATNGNEWDQDLWTLGVENGVVDLRTGQLRPGAKDDWITKRTGAPFDPDAQCPRWEQFLREVMCDDQEMIEYIHRALGYSLTGDMREQCFFLCIGAGANGKSILLDTLEYVWGTYGHRANMGIFVGGGDKDKYHLAEMAGRRLIFAAETKPGQRMNEHTVKNWTGGETQSVEKKFGHPFTFKPIGKLWLGVNHHPRVADDSYGFWRRVRMIEFNNTFTGSAEDRNLRDKLRAEAPGILAWAVRGCQAWLRHGLQTPIKVSAAVMEYQESEDPIRDFLSDYCEPNKDAVTSFRAIYAAYMRWAESEGLHPRDRITKRAMGSMMRSRFTLSESNGQKRYRGIELKPSVTPVGMYDAEHQGDAPLLAATNTARTDETDEPWDL